MNKTLEPLLEEKLEYSTVTALRDSLLRILPALRKRPTLRYLITKHGKPEAVLMSFPTYEAFKAVVKHAWDQESAKDRDTSLRDAIARMKADHCAPHRASRPDDLIKELRATASASEARSAVQSALEAIREDARRLDDLLTEESKTGEPPASAPLAQTE